jgi:hypothetical protein
MGSWVDTYLQTVGLELSKQLIPELLASNLTIRANREICIDFNAGFVNIR